MDPIESWWRLAGPASIVERVVRSVSKPSRVIVIETPDPRPAGLAAAIGRRLRSDLAFDCIEFDASQSFEGSIAHALGEIAGARATDVPDIEGLVLHPLLSDKAILVDGVRRQDVDRWGMFLRGLYSAAKSEVVSGPVVIVMAPAGLNRDDKRKLMGGAVSFGTMGAVTRYDTIAHLSHIGARPAVDVASRIGLAVAVDVAAWSRGMIERMASWDEDDQIDPMALLYREAEACSLPYPCWENGLVDLWDDEPVAHPVAALAHGLDAHVRRRIWAAQAGVVMPLADRVRRGFIHRYIDVLARRVSPESPFRKEVNGREITRTDPLDLEFYDLGQVLGDVLEIGEAAFLRVTKHVRDLSAHAKIAPVETVRRLSDAYENFRDRLESDLPGWDWPRAGQTLTMTVGPAASGKSSWAATQRAAVVCADDIRHELAPDGDLKGDQSEVFRRVRNGLSRELGNGFDVIADATHIKGADRSRQARFAPPDMPVRYVVVDRPLADKQRDAGWRAERGVVEIHHEIFAGEVEQIMSGDGFPNVEIVDLRELIDEASADRT